MTNGTESNVNSCLVWVACTFAHVSNHQLLTNKTAIQKCIYVGGFSVYHCRILQNHFSLVSAPMEWIIFLIYYTSHTAHELQLYRRDYSGTHCQCSLSVACRNFQITLILISELQQVRSSTYNNTALKTTAIFTR